MKIPRVTYDCTAAAQTEGLTDADPTAIIDDIQDELLCRDYLHAIPDFRRNGMVINRKQTARAIRLRNFASGSASAVSDLPVSGTLYQSSSSRKTLLQIVRTGFGLRMLSSVTRTAAADTSKADRHGFTGACPRVWRSNDGIPFHNAEAESFRKMRKVGEVHRAANQAFANMAASCLTFIEQVCNSKRLHSALGQRTPPEQIETLFAERAPRAVWPPVVQAWGFTPVMHAQKGGL